MTLKDQDIKLIEAIRLIKTKLPLLFLEIQFDVRNNQLIAKIDIGSKTGYGELTVENDEYWFRTRYDTVDTFSLHEDIVDSLSWVAWNWHVGYKERGDTYSNPHEEWVKIWIEDGRIAPVTKTVTEYKIV